jgi:hypothetical protein
MWSILSAVNLIDSLIVGTVFTGLALSKTARKNPSNLYILFLMFPEFILPFMCWITCSMSALKGEYWSPSMCRWQSVYLVFATGAHGWLNVVTTREIHRLLRSSRRMVRYFPPTLRTRGYTIGGHLPVQSLSGSIDSGQGQVASARR